MSASTGIGHRRGPMTACTRFYALEGLRGRPVRVKALGAPLAGPPIVARQCAPDEGTGSRRWGPSKGATEQ
jgi:hypothetical protein